MLVWTSGDGGSTLRAPEVTAELTPLVPASLNLRPGPLMKTICSLFQPVEDVLSVPRVPAQLTCLQFIMKICNNYQFGKALTYFGRYYKLICLVFGGYFVSSACGIDSISVEIKKLHGFTLIREILIK